MVKNKVLSGCEFFWWDWSGNVLGIVWEWSGNGVGMGLD